MELEDEVKLQHPFINVTCSKFLINRKRKREWKNLKHKRPIY